MTPVETMRGQSVALFGLGGSGLSTARALVDGGAEVAAWDDSPAARERASAAGIALVDLAEADWRGFKLFVLAPGVPADPSRAALDGQPCRRRGGSGRRRHRAFRPRARGAGARCAVRRDHRHQWQIDHHGADRPCAEGGRTRGGDGRQHRRAGARPAAARRREDACRRVLVLSDRSRALARAERRLPHQHYPGPS